MRIISLRIIYLYISAIKLQSSNHKSRLFLSRERNNESRYFIYILKRYFMFTYNYEVRPRRGFPADPGEGESREDWGEVQRDGRVSVSVSDSRRALRRAKKEENESERSARKEIRALVDSGPAAASYRLGAGLWTTRSLSSLSPSFFLNARGRKMWRSTSNAQRDRAVAFSMIEWHRLALRLAPCAWPIERRSNAESAGRKIESESADRIVRIEIAGPQVRRRAWTSEWRGWIDRAWIDRSKFAKIWEKKEKLGETASAPSVEVSTAYTVHIYIYIYIYTYIYIYVYSFFIHDIIPSPRSSCHDLSVESSSAHNVIHEEDIARTSTS